MEQHTVATGKILFENVAPHIGNVVRVRLLMCVLPRKRITVMFSLISHNKPISQNGENVIAYLLISSLLSAFHDCLREEHNRK